MAIYGNGRDYDLTLIPDAAMRTTTSQYLCVGMPGTTTATDRVIGVTCDTATTVTITPTATANGLIGVNQSYLSGTSAECTVRVFGLAKCTAAGSISAFDFVRAYQGVSTTTRRGQIVAVANGASVSVATQSISSHTVILGRALEDASTNTVITVFVNPSMYDNNLVS